MTPLESALALAVPVSVGAGWLLKRGQSEGRTDGVVSTKLDQVIGAMTRVETKIDGHAAEISALKVDVAEMKGAARGGRRCDDPHPAE